MSELRRADAALTEQDKTDIRRDLGLGTAAVANVPASGNAASGEVVKGNDTRLSDTRTPTTHSHTAAQVTDFAAAADARIAAASVNALADIDVTSPSVGQVLKWNGAAWVNDTDDTAAVGGATNLSYTPSPTGGTVHSDTGADATVPLSDGTNAGLLAPAQHAKLAGVAANATANSSDATLLARANHTGTQAASTISDFSAAADARISAAVGVTVASAAQGTDARDWNAATVDQAEAEAGTATTRRAWTAQRVAQAIAAQVAAWWAALTVGPSKITMGTARLLGRTTAGSGGAEEISVGSGLSLTAGTLSATGGGGGSPGGSSGQPQYNNAGAFGGMAGMTWNSSTSVLQFGGTTSGYMGLKGVAAWLQVRTADDSALGYLHTGVLDVGSGFGLRLQNASIGMGTGVTLGWNGGSGGFNPADTAFARNAAGVAEVNNGTAGTFRDLKLRSLIQQPPSSVTPASNGDLVFEATSNTTITVKLKGSDGTVRTGSITLS